VVVAAHAARPHAHGQGQPSSAQDRQLFGRNQEFDAPRDPGLASDQPRPLQAQHHDQLADQLAGLAYLQSQAYADSSRIGVMGGSYGGIQTLLGAEANPGYVAAVDCSGAAQSWASNPLLQARLHRAVSNITIPVFLLQAQNDFDLSPSRVSRRSLWATE